MTTLALQFVRTDLGESPKPGRWTEYVQANERIHEWACPYPACQPADHNETNQQIASEEKS